jgi:hypothetical protein
LLYSNASPSYDNTGSSEEEWDETIDANNPDNFNSNSEEEETI